MPDGSPNLTKCIYIHLFGELFWYFLAEINMFNVHFHKHIIMQLFEYLSIFLNSWVILEMANPLLEQRNCKIIYFQIIFLLVLDNFGCLMVNFTLNHCQHVFKQLLIPYTLLFLAQHDVVIACVDASVFKFTLSENFFELSQSVFLLRIEVLQ